MRCRRGAGAPPAEARQESEDDMSESLGQAVELLAAGDWKKAHEIVQKEKSTLAAWIHGIVHILEGDLDNARGWYKRAEREFPGLDREPRERERVIGVQTIGRAAESSRSRCRSASSR